jgi:signal transduction histidine kinase
MKLLQSLGCWLVHCRPNVFRRRSIAFRLILAVLAVELISAILSVALSFGFERHIHFHAMDVILHGRVDSILGAVQETGNGRDEIVLVKAVLQLPAHDVYEIFDGDGHLLARSTNWQGMPLDTPFPPQGPFLHRIINGSEYRILRFQGSRLIDGGKPSGGRIHQFTVFYGGRTEHVWEAIRASVELYATGNALLLLVTGPLIAWLLHRGLLPLRQLASLASGVSVDSWDFNPPASARDTPELAPLTLAIESVVQRLERSFLQQRAFVSDAAHELKTAVAVVKSSLQLLGLKPRTAEEYQAGLERCLSDSQRLEDLVIKMLTLARAESGSPSNGGAATSNLEGCLRQIIAELSTATELRSVQVNLAVAGSIGVPLAADDCSLLFTNLVLNAVQHSAPGSIVDIRVDTRASGAGLQVEIEDHGEGIDAAALPHVFDRFYRGDPSRTRNTGGTGLGLSICKAIVHRAGGSIAITSQAGLGTTVTVQLPLDVVEAIRE